MEAKWIFYSFINPHMTLSNHAQSYLKNRRISMKTVNKRTVGVVVGRFHVEELHLGHKHLISYVAERNRHLVIVIGTTCSFPNNRNPLTFDTRRDMVQKEFPDAVVIPLPDHKSDAVWNLSLDTIIEEMFPGATITLYGSRDSFLTTYNGRHKTEEIQQVSSISGTLHRERARDIPLASKAFRRGIIHAITGRPPVPYPTVDVAVIRPGTREVLLAGKDMDGGKLRFIGGFFDPALDKSFEAAARRETFEETGGLEVDEYRHLGSAVIDDWRYRGTNDSIITTFFAAKYIFGAPIANDDIDRLIWVPYEKIMKNLVNEHKALGEMLMKTLQ